MTYTKKDLTLLQGTINNYLRRLETYYLIQLDWFDRQAEIQKIDSYSYDLIEIIRPREPKAHTNMFLSGYLQALIDYDKQLSPYRNGIAKAESLTDVEGEGTP